MNDDRYRSRHRRPWTNRLFPVWPDMGARDLVTAWGDWATEMADAFDTLVGTMAPEGDRVTTAKRHRHRPADRHDTRCGECRTDNCHCNCCVYDADLVVYARAGEERVVPLRIINERSRERDIVLDLSEFTSSGGKTVPVHGSIATRSTFTLAACEQETAILALQIGGVGDDVAKREGRFEDVDDCLVAYADLRIQGCDVRPVRVAVAILPRDCDAYEVHCACGCC